MFKFEKVSKLPAEYDYYKSIKEKTDKADVKEACDRYIETFTDGKENRTATDADKANENSRISTR